MGVDYSVAGQRVAQPPALGLGICPSSGCRHLLPVNGEKGRAAPPWLFPLPGCRGAEGPVETGGSVPVGQGEGQVNGGRQAAWGGARYWPAISPLEGEMPGRAEGGIAPRAADHPPPSLRDISPSRGEISRRNASGDFKLNRKMRPLKRHMQGLNQAVSNGPQAIQSTRENAAT